MDRHGLSEQYTRAWLDADIDACLAAMAVDFEFPNPRVGIVTKATFPAYFESLMELIERFGGRQPGEPWMVLSDFVSKDNGVELTNWTWWRVPGTLLEGAGLNKVADRGVTLHRLAIAMPPDA